MCFKCLTDLFWINNYFKQFANDLRLGVSILRKMSISLFLFSAVFDDPASAAGALPLG